MLQPLEVMPPLEETDAVHGIVIFQLRSPQTIALPSAMCLFQCSFQVLPIFKWHHALSLKSKRRQVHVIWGNRECVSHMLWKITSIVRSFVHASHSSSAMTTKQATMPSLNSTIFASLPHWSSKYTNSLFLTPSLLIATRLSGQAFWADNLLVTRGPTQFQKSHQILVTHRVTIITMLVT